MTTRAGTNHTNPLWAGSPTTRQQGAAHGRVANVGVAVLGLLLTHEVGYFLATRLHVDHRLAAADHSHQGWLITIAGPLAVLAAATFVVRQARWLGITVTTSWPRLASAIATLYLAQESTELFLGGSTGISGVGSLLTNQAVPVGLLVSPVVAWLLVAVLTEAAKLAQAWLSIDSTLVVPAERRIRPSNTTFIKTALGGAVRARAPPFQLPQSSRTETHDSTTSNEAVHTDRKETR